MTLSLETEILCWIGEENQGTFGGPVMPVVPIQLLIIRLALSHKEGDGLTKSTELSLSTFDRANLYRVLRTLHRKQLIEFVHIDGSSLDMSEMQHMAEQVDQEQALGNIRLTDRGKTEITRLSRLRPGS
jgi:hypothetical protein